MELSCNQVLCVSSHLSACGICQYWLAASSGTRLSGQPRSPASASGAAISAAADPADVQFHAGIIGMRQGFCRTPLQPRCASEGMNATLGFPAFHVKKQTMSEEKEEPAPGGGGTSAVALTGPPGLPFLPKVAPTPATTTTTRLMWLEEFLWCV